MKYDYLVVGTGLAGAMSAHFATRKGRRCLVVEKKAKKIQEDIAFGLPLSGVDVNQIVKDVTDNQVINYKAISNGK